MDHAAAQAVAEGYRDVNTTGDLGFLSLFSPDFHDNVNGQRGLEVFPVVAG